MNRIEKAIALRIRRKPLPTAFDGWDKADREIAGTLITNAFDHLKRGGLVIFEDNEDERREEADDPRILAGEAVETSEGGIRRGGAFPNPNCRDGRAREQLCLHHRIASSSG